MIVTGLDGRKEELDAIRAGDLSATRTCSPAGTEGSETAPRVLKGEPEPGKAVLPPVRIMRDNVGRAQPAFWGLPPAAAA